MFLNYLNYLLEAWLTLVDYAMIVVYAQVVPDWHFILRVFLIAAFIFGSAFLTATIAETRRHKIKLHFLLGLLIPYIYPLVLALRLKVAQEIIAAEEAVDPLSGLSSTMSEHLKEIHEEQKSKHDKRIKRIMPEKQEDKIVEEEPAEQVVLEAEALEVEEGASVFKQRYFQELAVDSSGAKAGPFNLTVLNGSQFRVCQIRNIQADMASFEVDVKGKIKNIRIKYDNIESFEKI